MHDWTAEPVTAQGPRKGEPSSASMRHGFRTQPARLVRGSSRRIMTMRFRPANIRVINRRVCSWAVTGPAVPKSQRGTKPTVSFPFGISILPSTRLKAHQQDRDPANPPVQSLVDARTVLAVKGSLRRAKLRRALDSSAPFRPDLNRDGRLRRDHSMACAKNKRLAFLPLVGTPAEIKTPSNLEGLDKVAPYQKKNRSQDERHRSVNDRSVRLLVCVF